MYTTLKGIGKFLFVFVLRISLIRKFLNFTAFFTKNIKKINFSEFVFNFHFEKVNFSLIHPTLLPFIPLLKNTIKLLGFASYQ